MTLLRRSLPILALALVLAAIGLGLPALAEHQPLSPGSAQAAGESGATGFSRAEPGYTFVFPSDFGPHPDYQTEWWYYTGNLDTADGRHIGYQLTFFRRALQPAAERQARASSWATEQIYMAHFALTDVAGRRFSSFERFSRGAAGLAGAQAAPFAVWLDDWSVSETSAGTRRLRAAHEGIAIDLTLELSKPAVLQGIDGYSQKGSDAGNASYYYSLSRMKSRGTVSVGGENMAVGGLSWMDHEWSTSALASNQVGWDWFALQLDDGSDIMLYHVRTDDGGIDPLSSGTLIAADGSSRRLDISEFSVNSDATWRSPHSGASYPARWQIAIPSAGLSLAIEPYTPDQELNLSFVYWEGAVRITGNVGGRAVAGHGYVELTGYASSMQGQF
jgi:predicted secreted hydrolase